MLTLKQLLARLVLGAEILLFGFLYFFGAHGRKAIITLTEENEHLRARISVMQRECDQLSRELAVWKEQTWYQEKRARESLQMAFPDEEVILTDVA